MKSLHQRMIVASVLVGAAWTLIMPAVAFANQYGELRLTKSKKLLDDQFGNVIIDADNVTLDCDGHMVHISSFTKSDCYGPYFTSNPIKCAIQAHQRSNVTIKNCRVVGGFDVGVFLEVANNSVVADSQVAGPYAGFFFQQTTGLNVSRLVANSTTSPFTVYLDSGDTYYGLDAGESEVGLWVGDTSNSSFSGVSVAYASYEGTFCGDCSNVQFDGLEIEQSGTAFRAQNSDRISLTNSYFIYNKAGIKLESVKNSLIQSNQVFYNDPCDAQQDAASTNNTWINNFIQSPCAGVPTPH